MTTQYKELETATSEELLEAVVWFWQRDNPDCERWLRLGFAIAQPGGWRQIAPVWLQAYVAIKERDESPV